MNTYPTEVQMGLSSLLSLTPAEMIHALRGVTTADRHMHNLLIASALLIEDLDDARYGEQPASIAQMIAYDESTRHCGDRFIHGPDECR